MVCKLYKNIIIPYQCHTFIEHTTSQHTPNVVVNVDIFKLGQTC